MDRISRAVMLVCGVGLAYILLWNFGTGRLNPVVYESPWRIIALVAYGVVMALVAILDSDRTERRE